MLRNRTARSQPQSVQIRIGHIDPTRFRPQDFARGETGTRFSLATPVHLLNGDGAVAR